MARLVAERDETTMLEVYSGRHDGVAVVVLVSGVFSTVMKLEEVDAVIAALTWARDQASDSDATTDLALTKIETN